MQRDNTPAWILGAAAGAAAMYLLDPRSGRRRRALLRDRAVHLVHTLEGSAVLVAQDAANRARGTAARARQRLSTSPVDDVRLTARVRARLGHVAGNASAIRVSVREGRVLLEGPVRSAEMGDVLGGVRSVPGVRVVESRLELVGEPTRGGGVGARLAAAADLLDQPLTPASRGLLGLAGGLLALWGLRRGGSAGALTATAGACMLTRAATNLPARELLGATRHAGTVQKTVDVGAPLEEVFAFWSNFRNFPHFMQHLREVRETESGISHWTADGPAGIPVTWDAEITALQPHRRIAWRSLPGSLVENAGEVRFEDLDEALTRVRLRMTYSPPAGAVGHAVTALFGADPRRQVAEDLNRFKRLLEAGRVQTCDPAVVQDNVQTAGRC